MSAVIRKLALPRRTFLRGVGASLALPWLSAMEPALGSGESAAARPLRHLFVFLPNGIKMDDWTPSSAGRLGALPFLLEPLRPHRDHLTVISGLALDGARAHGDGPGDHARAAAAFLTCAHPRKTGGSDIEVGVSVDQVLAREIGGATPFRSLELGMEPGRRAGVCDSGYSCAYSNNVSWRTPSTPVAKETDPRAVFTRLFGDPEGLESRAEADRRNRRRLAVLDFVLEDARRLRRRLGVRDRAKIEEYLDAVRDLERRLEDEDARPEAPVDPGLLEGAQQGFPKRLAIMYEMIALAFESDLTRVASFMIGNAGSNRSHRHIDVAEGHHDLSHHGKDPEKLAKIRKINRFHLEAFAAFVARLKGSEAAGASVLDDAVVVLGSGIADGNRHAHHDLPYLIAGKGGGLRGGRHLVFEKDTPAADLYLALLRRAGVAQESFGDSRGALPGL